MTKRDSIEPTIIKTSIQVYQEKYVNDDDFERGMVWQSEIHH